MQTLKDLIYTFL